MQLPNYGVLKGPVVGHSPQEGGKPHYQIFVKGDGVSYRIAFNVDSVIEAQATELYYAVLENPAGQAWADLLARVNANPGKFHLRQSGGPSLDFVRGGLTDLHDQATWLSIPDGVNPLSDESGLYKALVDACSQAVADPDNCAVAAFGTRFTSNGIGIDNVHMNQGNLRIAGKRDFSKENAPNQDGGLIFFLNDKVLAFFVRFSSQDIDTNADGSPKTSGVAELDAPLPELRAALAANSMKTRVQRVMANTPQGLLAGSLPTGRVFADHAADHPDPNHVFQPDNDSDLPGADKKFADQFAVNGVPEPVPAPRGGVYPRMDLETVIPGIGAATAAAGKIVFHSVGDTGAPSAQKLPHEEKVADLMSSDLSVGDVKPSFLFHLGDVVYFYGEKQYYYDQFFEPFSGYNAPIFAIPGNHDAITYDSSMTSLESFLKVFVDSAPSYWDGSGGISRTTMDQPGVYFTLDCPGVYIVGLYSNCSEGAGYLDDPQKVFFYQEMARLKAQRDGGDTRAIVLAVHHPPISYSASKPSSLQMLKDLDIACEHAGIYPDLVLSGHAHYYQRVTRTVTVNGQARQIPYITSGSGGYNDRLPFGHVPVLPPTAAQVGDVRREHLLEMFGYLRITVEPGTSQVTVDFMTTTNGTIPADTCRLNYATGALV